nr:MAG TPA: hypothetical protein [Bacteriophage sp.]
MVFSCLIRIFNSFIHIHLVTSCSFKMFCKSFSCISNSISVK